LRYLAVSLALLLGNCGGGYNRLEGPVVDTRNIDQNKYNKDLADCQDRKRNASFVGSARIITDCMTERGYSIIEPRG
jgi:hypothetical protein